MKSILAYKSCVQAPGETSEKQRSGFVTIMNGKDRCLKKHVMNGIDLDL